MSNKKKMEVLYFVEQYIKRYGYPPTVRDMRETENCCKSI